MAELTPLTVMQIEMTLREFYVGCALIGLIHSPGTFGCTGDSTIGEMAVKLADAAIVAIEKEDK